MVHFYVLTIKMLFATKILRQKHTYSVILVSTKINGCVPKLWSLLGVLCKDKIEIVSNFKEYEKKIEQIIKKHPNDKLLIAAYNCEKQSNIGDAIGELVRAVETCFEMLEVLKKSPMQQSFWVKSNHATGKSRV